MNRRGFFRGLLYSAVTTPIAVKALAAFGTTPQKLVPWMFTDAEMDALVKRAFASAAVKTERYLRDPAYRKQYNAELKVRDARKYANRRKLEEEMRSRKI